jgi:hypothetical protein
MTASNLVPIPELFVSQESAAKLKAEAAALEEEIEQIRTEESSQEVVPPAEKTE